MEIKINIFYLDKDLTKAAQYHVDKHVVKMILEYAQLLSTAHRLCDGVPYESRTKTGRRVKRWGFSPRGIDPRAGILYEATHINHPSAVWARASNNNYNALAYLLGALCTEYTHRYGKIHKVQSSGLAEMLMKPPHNIAIGNFTQPTPAMPDGYKVPGDSVESYRNYYIGAKQRMAKWTKRDMPDWYVLEKSWK